jgi:hypothetical protein
MAQIYEDSLEKVGEEYGPLSLQMEDKLKEVIIIYLRRRERKRQRSSLPKIYRRIRFLSAAIGVALYSHKIKKVIVSLLHSSFLSKEAAPATTR